MITVYGIDKNKIYNNQTKQISESDGIDKNWTRKAPPSLNTGEYALYSMNRWIITDRYPSGNNVAAPSVVTMRQARLQLLEDGILDQVVPTISNLPSPQKEQAEIEWEYAQTVQRDSELVSLLADELSLTEADLDNMFVNASKR